MFAIAAAAVFGLAFLLNLVKQPAPYRVSLLYLGLTLLALEFALGKMFPLGRRRS